MIRKHSKNHKAREIPLDDDMLATIAALKAQASHREAVPGWTRPGRLTREHVFVSQANTAWRQHSHLLRKFYKCCAKAGIEGAHTGGDVDIHSLRVTFTTLAIEHWCQAEGNPGDPWTFNVVSDHGRLREGDRAFKAGCRKRAALRIDDRARARPSADREGCVLRVYSGAKCAHSEHKSANSRHKSLRGQRHKMLGSGLLNIYPPEHEELAAQVAACGALLSEAPPRGKPVSGAFPQRNRLITGLSSGVVVVEAAERSGALISAEHAMEQGREVFAVPGPVDSRTSRGCHRLLREGAKLVEHVEDVLEELGPLATAVAREDGCVVRHPAELLLNDQEQAVLQVIAENPTNIDEVVVNSGLPVHRVLATISVLEMRHLIRRISGQLVARV